MGKTKTNSQFINELKLVQPELEVVGMYVNTTTRVLVRDRFGICSVMPPDLLAGHPPTIKTAIDKDLYFAAKANRIHNGRYDYSSAGYTRDNKHVSIICKEHGVFNQIATHHLRGSNCPKCVKKGGYGKQHFIRRSNGRECILYIIKCWNDNEAFYKIGITSRSIYKRFISPSCMPYEYEVIKEIRSFDPSLIYDKEQILHRSNKEYKYLPKIHFEGCKTECFTSIELIK